MKKNKDINIFFEKQGSDSFLILVKCNKTGKLIAKRLFTNSMSGEMKKFIEKVRK